MTLKPAILLAALAITTPAQAGTIETFVRGGYFSWQESSDTDSKYVREDGPFAEGGINYTIRPLPMVAATGSASARIAATVYQGHKFDPQTGTFSDPVTAVGLFATPRLAVGLAGEIPAGPVKVGPAIEVSAEYTWRPQSSEHWFATKGRAGFKASYFREGVTFVIEGGATKPLYTVNRWDTGDAGLGEINLYPKGKVAPYFELKAATATMTVGALYEENRWDRSDNVAVASTTTAGGAIIGGSGYQPKTVNRLIGLNIGWWF